MGTVFSLYKRKPKQRYALGKHRHGFVPGAEPSNIAQLWEDFNSDMRSVLTNPHTTIADIERITVPAMAFRDPGWSAMWSIMGNPNYVVFKLSRFSREELADIMYRASPSVASLKVGLKVADHMLAWAGDDDITLNSEEEDELAELGWPTRGYKNVGGIWDAMK